MAVATTPNRAQRRAGLRESEAAPPHRPPDQDGGDTLFRQAVEAQHAGRLDEAEQAYLALLTRNPRHRQALNNLGVIRRHQGRPGEAVEILERALALSPEDPGVHGNLGLALCDASAHARAVPHLRRAVAARPDETGLLLRLSMACTYCARHDEAESLARRIAALLPDSAGAHHHLGWALVNVRRLAEARSAFARAASLDPEDTDAALMLTVLEGGTPPAADAYARFVCGSYEASAAFYEAGVVPVLQNRTPQLLRALLDDTVGTDLRHANALDLACGTGLMGEQVRPLTERLTGVDLSPAMAAHAERKGIYDRLVVADAVAFLGNEDGETFDLFSCSDALIHFGDLAPLLDAVVARARPGALVLFSVEHHEGESFLLDPSSARYRHGYRYVTTLLRERGCPPAHG